MGFDRVRERVQLSSGEVPSIEPDADSYLITLTSSDTRFSNDCRQFDAGWMDGGGGAMEESVDPVGQRISDCRFTAPRRTVTR